jgi:hypothetical protein
MLKVAQHATTSALIFQKQPLPSCCSQTGWKITPALFKKSALTTRIFALSLEYPKEKRVLHATPLPAKQNTARSNVRPAHLSSLEQSCSGATYYKQSILVRNI